MLKQFKPAAVGIVWIVVLAVILVMSLSQRRESGMFYGIAETDEVKIGSEHAVEIRRVAVVAGKPVAKGDTLVVLDRQDLTQEINEIAHQLEQHRAAGADGMRLLHSRVEQLKAEKAQKTADLNSQIVQLRTQIAINKELASGLKSIEKSLATTSGESQNPLLIRLKGLEDELRLMIQPFDIQISQLQAAMASPRSVDNIQVEKLERDLALLEQEKRDLVVFAPIDGCIGSVYHREGEQVSSFEPILTVNARAPSYIKGFIHENVYNSIAEGQRVQVQSLAEKKSRVAGTVVGVGTRIVEYPVRLRKRPEIQIWGREVIIRIPAQNPFLQGEKVMVSVIK
jgi:multidrug resistance efflux pump